jgi:hypothetical protein
VAADSLGRSGVKHGCAEPQPCHPPIDPGSLPCLNLRFKTDTPTTSTATLAGPGIFVAMRMPLMAEGIVSP